MNFPRFMPELALLSPGLISKLNDKCMQCMRGGTIKSQFLSPLGINEKKNQSLPLNGRLIKIICTWRSFGGEKLPSVGISGEVIRSLSSPLPRHCLLVCVVVVGGQVSPKKKSSLWKYQSFVTHARLPNLSCSNAGSTFY